MATATKKGALPVPPPPPIEVTLVLSHEEAQELKNVLSKVAGRGPRRDRLNAITDALSKVGYSYERDPGPNYFHVKGYDPATNIRILDEGEDLYLTPGKVYMTNGMYPRGSEVKISKY